MALVGTAAEFRFDTTRAAAGPQVRTSSRKGAGQRFQVSESSAVSLDEALLLRCQPFVHVILLDCLASLPDAEPAPRGTCLRLLRCPSGLAVHLPVAQTCTRLNR